VSAPRSASGIAGAVASGEATAAEVVRGALDRIARADDGLNSFLQVFADEAPAWAGRVDERVRAGEALPLAGVPLAVKDTICFEHGRTTCGSRFLEGYASPFTATALGRLIDAGAVVVGKTNCDEFAMGSSGENSAFGATRNPWATDRAPGGSSSGSAAAVAAGLAPIALGSDTGGSIRQPASYCGVVGLKPTYGAVSRYGLVAFASSLDQIGPFASTVDDVARVFEALAGHDPLDATSVVRPDVTPPTGEGAAGLRVGVPRDIDLSKNDPEVNDAFERSVRALGALGAEVVDVELPHLPHAIAAYYIVAPSEASSNLARYDGVRFGRRATPRPGEGLEEMYARSRAEGFGPEVQRRIMLGTFTLSAGYYDDYYGAALRARRLVKEDFDRAFERCDAIALPTAPTPAIRLGECVDDPITMYLQDIYTVPASLAGLPGLSVPMGVAERDGSGLPLGLQLIAPHFAEATLFRLGGAFEADRGPLPNAPGASDG
jgi:aspartyl-tRNA(Asn)/glutamyl-tRNA(Gln) amidotransferase subunit A